MKGVALRGPVPVSRQFFSALHNSNPCVAQQTTLNYPEVINEEGSKTYKMTSKQSDRSRWSIAITKKDIIVLVVLCTIVLSVVGVGVWNYYIETRLKALEIAMAHSSKDGENPRLARQDVLSGDQNHLNDRLPSAHVFPCATSAAANPRVSDYITENGYLHNFWKSDCSLSNSFSHLEGNMTIKQGSFIVVPITGLYHIYGQVALKQREYEHQTTGGFNLHRVCFRDRLIQSSTLEKFVIHPPNHRFTYPYVAGTFEIKRGCGIGVTVDPTLASQCYISNKHTQTFLGAFLVEATE